MRQNAVRQRLKKNALSYLERYESSEEILRAFLKRKIESAFKKENEPVPPETTLWIEMIVSEMKRSGYVDDERFAVMKVRQWRSAGKSERYIRFKLSCAGIEQHMQDAVLGNGKDDCANEDLKAAKRLVEKRKIGCFRLPQDRKLYRKKDLAVLARAGFSYPIAVQALGERDGDEKDVFEF